MRVSAFASIGLFLFPGYTGAYPKTERARVAPASRRWKGRQFMSETLMLRLPPLGLPGLGIGYTGLTITIGAILTLAILMQITAKVDWEQKLSMSPAAPGAPGTPLGTQLRRRQRAAEGYSPSPSE